MLPRSRAIPKSAHLRQTRFPRAGFSTKPPSPDSIPRPPTTIPTPLLPSVPRLNATLPRLRALASRTGVPLPSIALSFLILHELTALVPLIALFFIFQALGAGAGVVAWISSLSRDVKDGERWEWRRLVGKWYEEGQRRVERVGRGYGILGYNKAVKLDPGEVVVEEDPKSSTAAEKVADAIAAYVAVKALLPLRIGVSVGAAPAFARFALEPTRRIAWRLGKRGKG